MANRYENLLSPFRIGNVVFRNRLFTAPMGLHALQGGELYPTDAIIQHYANKARGGAAVVTCSGTASWNVVPDNDHLAYDIYIGHSQHYLAQLADSIHFYGAKASMEIQAAARDSSYYVVGGLERLPGLPPGTVTKEMTPEIMEEVKQNLKDQVRILKRLGYDMCMLHMAYDMGIYGAFLNTRVNTRKDAYGGSLENRLRFLCESCDAIHEAGGKDFLIELRMSGELPEGSGFTIDDACQMARILEGHVDILHVHAGTGWQAHCMSFEPDTPNLWMAQRIKQSGTTIPVLTIGGYQNLDEMEAAIAEGKADLVSMARGWLADPNLGLKAYENRPEDVVPCVKCMRCHDSACIDGTTFVCTVNPLIGIEHKLPELQKPAASRKVAVVGGGPAGMQAALTAASRGHAVTLYEAKDVLGGQLNFADHVEFKHSLAKYKNWLVAQVQKAAVDVKLSAPATRELLEAGGYDAVIAALGAEPVIPGIPGVELSTPACEIYGHEETVGESVVIIGGGQVGCETALHLTQLGRKVTVLEMQPKILADASASYRNRLTRNMDYHRQTLQRITGAQCTGISAGSVRYLDADGQEQSLACDSIIMAAGMRACQTDAMALYSPAYRLYTVGDCDRAANVQKATRAAFAAAVSIV